MGIYLKIRDILFTIIIIKIIMSDIPHEIKALQFYRNVRTKVESKILIVNKSFLGIIMNAQSILINGYQIMIIMMSFTE